MPDKKDAYFQQVKQLGALITVPVILLVGPLVGFFFGSWLDRKFGLHPFATTGFVILGFIASGREVVRLLKQISKGE